MFSEYYFYVIGYLYKSDTPNDPIYFRTDRIINVQVHREKYVLSKEQNVDEGMLRRKSQFMWPGFDTKNSFRIFRPVSAGNS